MGKKPVVQMRYSKESDASFIKKWLLQPKVLRGFPLCNEREIDDAIRIWMEHVPYKSSLTALYKKEPCGACNLYFNRVKKLSHQALFVIIVDQKYWREGIGTLLMRALEKMAKEGFGIEILHLEVYEDNPAIRFYEKLGFTHYGTHPQFLKEREGVYLNKVLMQKVLV